MAKLSTDEKKWRAEADAETMARYEEIMRDSSRRAAAIKIASQKAADLTKRANAMTRVATTGSRATKVNKK